MRRYLIALALVAGVFCFAPAHAKAAAYSYSWVSQSGYGTVNRDAHKDAKLDLQNTGTGSWSFSNFHLGTSRPLDRGSCFNDGWASDNRIALSRNVTDPSNSTSINPGQTGEFEFTVSPQPCGSTEVSGAVNEYFRPVVDGVTWLPDVGIYWRWTVPAPVGMVMFDWYGANGYRWGTLAGCCKTVDTPNFGTISGQYGSGDSGTYAQQLSLMQAAGIDYVILDFWLNTDSHAAQIQANAFAIADYITANMPKLKFSFVLESSDSAVTQASYDLIYNHFTDHSHFQTYLGQPVLYTYAVTPTYDSRFTQWLYSDGNSGSNTIYWTHDPLQSKNNTFNLTPSFDNCAYANPCSQDDPNQTGALWNNQWNPTNADRDYTKALTIYGWNEYYERSQVEPHTRTGTTNATDNMYQRVRNSLGAWKS